MKMFLLRMNIVKKTIISKLVHGLIIDRMGKRKRNA